MPSNTQEVEARLRKVTKLMDAVKALNATVDQAGANVDVFWLTERSLGSPELRTVLSASAQINDPSDETWALFSYVLKAFNDGVEHATPSETGDAHDFVLFAFGK
jgi:hypothetical protein